MRAPPLTPRRKPCQDRSEHTVAILIEAAAQVPMTSPTSLNHLGFPSHDPAATAAFFERQLGCTVAPFGTGFLARRPGFDIVF